MSTTRLFSPIELIANSEINLGADQARYIGKVLRQRPGDTLTLFDGAGGEWRAIIISIAKSDVVVKIDECLHINVESPLSIHLLQCVSRGERMDFVVQKATELGVSRITPVVSEFSVVKFDKSRAEKRRLHWSRIAVSACEQCGRNKLPQIDPPLLLRDWFGENLAATGQKLVLMPGATTGLATVAPTDDKLTILIGPEGGLSDTENENAAAAGFTATGLGPRILRTETAAISAIATLQALYGDLASD